ncbi:MAG: aminotransferase class I/II-fold pyridoxal phosphate-dependent enzyme [Sphaerochaetaceae bacterium]|nr:aminotransferase class I/II-fold pyridoxal phosphate-dependent enzyme [Sphaerochaetaceae bacterium]
MHDDHSMTTPFASHLSEYVTTAKSFYCMPGHKQGLGAPPLLKELWGEQVFAYDITEVKGSDVLAYPRTSIKEAQKVAADIMGAHRSWFLVNGSSVGIHAVLGALVKPGQKVLVHRQCHKALLFGLVYSGAIPVYLEPVQNLPEYAYGSVDLQKVDELLTQHDIKMVMVTSPNYYGLALNIAAISSICRTHSVPLFVDEAHGTHFSFHEGFPHPALKQGADFVVQSMHKTLGGLYQSALVHSAGTYSQYEDKIARMLSMLQTTSPSALMIMSIDAALDEANRTGRELYGQMLAMLESLRYELNTSNFQVIIPPPGVMSAGNFVAYDQMKLLFMAVSEDFFNLMKLKVILSEQYGIEIELADENHMLLTLSLADAIDLDQTRENLIYFSETLERLVDRGFGLIDEPDDFEDPRELPEFFLTPRDAFYAEKKRMKLSESVSEVSGNMVCIYPPGFPQIIPGEMIHEAVIHQIYHDFHLGFTIVGVDEEDGELYIDVIEESFPRLES